MLFLRLSPPSDPDDELERFCRHVCLVSQRDMDGTATAVVRVMLQAARSEPVGSSRLAELARLNRVTVIHHLHRLEQMGLVAHTGRKYQMSVGSFSDMVRQMRTDTEEMLSEVEEMARRIDAAYRLGPPVISRARVRLLLPSLSAERTPRRPKAKKRIR